jgi:hypothetical protein
VGRWTTTAEAPSEQTFELPAYSTAVVQNEPDVSEARRQVRHAKEQLDLAGQSAGRKAAKGPAPNPAKIQILSHMFPGKSCCTSNVER